MRQQSHCNDFPSVNNGHVERSIKDVHQMLQREVIRCKTFLARKGGIEDLKRVRAVLRRSRMKHLGNNLSSRVATLFGFSSFIKVTQKAKAFYTLF
jgi:hypothetical protein